MSEEVKVQNENVNVETTKVAVEPSGDGAFIQDRPRQPRGMKPKRRVCPFCANKTAIDYKDVNRLRKYISEKGKIITRRHTGLCAAHQREITNAVKRARNMSLL